MGKEMTICPDCGKEVKLQGLAAHKRIVHGGGIIPRQGNQEAISETPSITAPKTLTLSGEDLGIADMLIRSGFSKDLNELTHKSLNLTYSNLNRIGGYMENPREETMDDVNKMRDRDIVRKYKELAVKAMEKELESKDKKEPEAKIVEKPSDEDKVIQQIEKQIRLKALKKASSDDDFDFDKLMKYKMMDKMFGGSERGSEVQALQNQLNSMQQQMQQERLVASQQLQNERVMQKIEQAMNQAQPGLTAQDVLTFTTDKERAVKEVDMRLQAEREKLTAERLTQLQQQIQQAQQSGGLTSQRIQSFSEELKAIKSLAGEFGDREKGAGEYISETIGNVAATLQPALTKLIEQKQQRAQYPQYPQFPQEYPQPGPPEPQLPPAPPEFSDLSPAEREMSDQMSDMYIKRK